MKLEAGLTEGSYYITNFVLEGNMKDQWGYMFIDAWDAIWVDNTKDGKPNNQYTFESQNNGTYKIGLSSQNAEFNPKNYPNAYLGTIPMQKDNKIYICDEDNTLGYNMADCKVIWYFVSAENYATYSAAMKQYQAAVALGASIEEAEELPGVDATTLNAAKEVYNNTSSTPEELTAQKEALDNAIGTAKLAIATVDNPVDLMPILDIASDFNDGNTRGWECTTNAQNKQASNGNAAKDFATTGNHYENWKGDAMAAGGKVYATATNLSAGVYHLNALAFTNTGKGLYLYAGNSQTPVTATNIDIDKPTDVYTYCAGGELEFGLVIQEKSPNWIGMDNVQLFYIGDAPEAYELLISERLATEPDYAALDESGELYCQKSVYENYKEALEAFNSEAADKVQALANFDAAAQAMAKSVAAYKVYYDKFEEANTWLDTTTGESDEVNLVADYIMGDDEPGESYNKNGSALYILENGLLDEAQITAEETHLTTLYAKTSGGDFTKPVMNLCEGAADTDLGVKCYTLSNGKYAPDGTSPTAEFFKQGYYLNELVFTVPEDGEVTIGLSKTEVLANDYEVVGEWKLWYMGDEAPVVDVSDLIVNNNFDPDRGDKNEGRIDGWTTTAMNGYKQYSVSYNRAPFELNQKLSGLPKGKYRVTVHTYYRAGYYDEEEARIKNGEETHLTTLYANTSAGNFTKPVMNLSEGAADTDLGVKCYTLSNGKFAPDGTTPTVEFFKQGYYLNELEFVVPEDGEVTIGLSKTELYANDYEVVGEWKLYYLGAAEELVDVSDLIVNANYDPDRGDKNEGRIDGWTTTAMNGYKQYSVSYNRAPFELYQDLSGLPEGFYKATVHTYYRAGYYDEEEARIAKGEETHLTTLYATTSLGEFTKPVMNLSEGAADSDLGVNCYTLSNGQYAPDGTTPTVAFFAAGYYLNEIEFEVGIDGKARIGLSKTETYANDYEVVGEWKLYYYKSGAPVAIDPIAPAELSEPAVPVAFFSASGTRLAAPQKGINIVRMSNGTVKKILVK